MTDDMLPGTAELTRRISGLEKQAHAILFLSAANMIANVATLVLWGLLSLA